MAMRASTLICFFLVSMPVTPLAAEPAGGPTGQGCQGAITSGSADVIVEGKQAAAAGDTTSCGDTVVQGSSNVFINGKPAAVVGDKLIAQTEIPYVVAQDPDGNGISDVEVATSIVQLKAMYGKDATVDNGRTVDTWNTVTPANAAEWMQVRAVKVAVLARSGQYEKTPVYTPAGCTTSCTPPAPSWTHPGTGASVPFTMANLADGTDWRNYRYRVYQTTVPLRNMIWSNDP